MDLFYKVNLLNNTQLETNRKRRRDLKQIKEEQKARNGTLQ